MPLTNYYELLSILGQKLHWSKETCENCYFYELEQMVEILTKQTDKENAKYKNMEAEQAKNTPQMSVPNVSMPNISMPNISIPKF